MTDLFGGGDDSTAEELRMAAQASKAAEERRNKRLQGQSLGLQARAVRSGGLVAKNLFDSVATLGG